MSSGVISILRSIRSRLANTLCSLRNRPWPIQATARRLLSLALIFSLAYAPGGAAVGPAVAQIYGNPFQGQATDPYGNAPSASATANNNPSNSGSSGSGQATASPFTSQAPAYSADQLQTQSSQPTIVVNTAGDTAGGSGDSSQTDSSDARGTDARQTRLIVPKMRLVRPPVPGEFQKFVEKTLGEPLARFGASLQTDQAFDYTPASTTTVPPDYVLNPGDEVIVHVTGSLEGDVHLTINSDGRVFLPHIGAIDLAGVRYGDLQALMTARVGEQYKNFKVAVAIGRLHGIRVYVTGYAARPGAYTVNSLSTLVNAVMAAGGPSAGGSYRSVQLRRDGQLVTDFDLYDLLLRGDKSHDVILQNEDVIYVAPVGPEVAITGSVNAEAIYEAKPGETLGGLLKDAGGLSSLADPEKTYVSRLTNLDKMGWEQIDLTQALTGPVLAGDILRVTSIADYARPQERQAIVVKLEGEVSRPGRYYLAPNSTIADLMAQAGGLTDHAFVYGSELDRVTVKQQQQAGFDQALQDLELSIAESPLSLSGIDASAATNQAGRVQLARQIIEQMRTRKPDGRLVLNLGPQSTSLPGDFVLENDDRIFIPPPPTSVGVFGAIYQQGSFVYRPTQTIGDYLKLAGGPERHAQKADMFVVRANGSVVAKREQGWGQDFEKLPALPGDVIFVPIKTEPSLLWDRLVQATTVLYNFGLGAAAIKVLTQ